jgi:hypothetical protein
MAQRTFGLPIQSFVGVWQQRSGKMWSSFKKSLSPDVTDEFDHPVRPTPSFSAAVLIETNHTFFEVFPCRARDTLINTGHTCANHPSCLVVAEL